MLHATTAAIAIGALASASLAMPSFTTVFGPGGASGQQLPADDLLNGLEAFTNFGTPNGDTGPLLNTPNVGQTLFFQIGPFYVGGAGPATSNPLSDQGLENFGGPLANNRAYGVIGAGRSDITFDAGTVSELTLQVRGSADGQVTGTNPGTNFGGVPSLLDDAQGTLLVYTELGIQTQIQIQNDGYTTLSFDVSAFDGESITRIGLINEGPLNSAVAIGELTATVPAPGAAALLGLGGCAVIRRRRGG